MCGIGDTYLGPCIAVCAETMQWQWLFPQWQGSDRRCRSTRAHSVARAWVSARSARATVYWPQSSDCGVSIMHQFSCMSPKQNRRDLSFHRILPSVGGSHQLAIGNLSQS